MTATIVSPAYVVAATGSPVIMGLSAPGTCDCPRRNQNRTRPVSSPTSPRAGSSSRAAVFSSAVFPVSSSRMPRRLRPVVIVLPPRSFRSATSLDAAHPDLPPSTEQLYFLNGTDTPRSFLPNFLLLTHRFLCMLWPLRTGPYECILYYWLYIIVVIKYMLSTLEVHLSVCGYCWFAQQFQVRGERTQFELHIWRIVLKYRTYVLNTLVVINDFFLITFKLLEFRKIDCIIWNTPIIDPCVIL